MLLHFIIQAKKFPALQRNGHISVFPEEIVEGAQAERISFLPVSVGEEFVNLQFAYLIRNRLPGGGWRTSRLHHEQWRNPSKLCSLDTPPPGRGRTRPERV